MKKLYRKGTVHPSPSPSPPQPQPQPPQQPPLTADQFSLSYLPAAILTLATALSSDDQQVLSYLLSCSSATPFDFDPSKKSPHHRKKSPPQHHQPSFTCYCFTCYTSYWARWDSSPNRQRIHEIIDAFEDGLLAQRKKKQGISRREKRKNSGNNNSKGLDLNLKLNVAGGDSGSDGSGRVNPELGRLESVEEGGGQLGHGEDETGEKQGSVRKLVSFIGERIWGSVWG